MSKENFNDITDIYQARRIMNLLHHDMRMQFYGKVFYAVLSVIFFMLLIYQRYQ